MHGGEQFHVVRRCETGDELHYVADAVVYPVVGVGAEPFAVPYPLRPA